MGPGQTDPDYAYSPQKQRRLAQNLAAIYSDIEAGTYSSHLYSIDLFCAWHQQLFEGVRDHAGSHRSPDFGPETLVFGPNSSVHRSLVPEELRTHCETSNRLIREAQARAAELDIHFVREAVKIAAYVHADLIRIHPFVDGNGRVARLVLDWILMTLGLPFVVAFHIPVQEYRDVLNRYYATFDIDPLVDLVLRVLGFGLA
jgi:Fic family protein